MLAMDYATTLSEISRMTVEERIRLAQEIWEGIPPDSAAPDLSDEMKLEIERRLREHEANPNDVIPWERIRAEALARVRR
jgi:putative addiction module component (TIGR02574 family)